MAKTVTLTGPRQRDFAKRLIDEAADGDQATIGAATRTAEQNAKLHPMIRDIKRQVPRFHDYSEQWVRDTFMDALEGELRFLPKLYGEGSFPVGRHTSTLSKRQFSGLLEMLYKFGAENDVAWSDPLPEELMQKGMK